MALTKNNQRLRYDVAIMFYDRNFANSTYLHQKPLWLLLQVYVNDFVRYVLSLCSQPSSLCDGEEAKMEEHHIL